MISLKIEFVEIRIASENFTPCAIFFHFMSRVSRGRGGSGSFCVAGVELPCGVGRLLREVYFAPSQVLSDKCALCNQPETMRHALSNCKTALDQGRLTFRHNSILLHIVKQMRASKKHSGKRIIADLPGFCLPDGGTIPPELVVTNQKPEIVLIEEKTNAVKLFELTSCADSKENIKNAQARKKVRYEVLKSELNAKLQCFEVCALGNIPSHARETIRYLVGKKAARETFKSLAKIAISASYYIFNRRLDTEWHSPSYFERPVVNYGAKE